MGGVGVGLILFSFSLPLFALVAGLAGFGIGIFAPPMAQGGVPIRMAYVCLIFACIGGFAMKYVERTEDSEATGGAEPSPLFSPYGATGKTETALSVKSGGYRSAPASDLSAPDAAALPE